MSSTETKEVVTEPHHAETKREFILTSDLRREVMWLNKLMPNKRPIDTLYLKQFEQAIADKLATILDSNIEVVSLQFSFLEESIERILDERRYRSDKFFRVNASRELNIHGAYNLDMTRLANHRGEHLGHGSRSHAQPLADQFIMIRKEANGRPVVFIDDGTFKGTTVKRIVDEAGIKLEAVVVGIAFPGAKASLLDHHATGQYLDPDRIISVKDFVNPLDWVPMHDFLPFFVGCGKVYGHQDGVPYYNDEGFHYCIPYIEPFTRGKMGDWASIEDPIKAVAFSKFCLEQDIELFRYIEEYCNKKVLINDLVGKDLIPSIGLPFERATDSTNPVHATLVDTKMRVIDFLDASLQKID